MDTRQVSDSGYLFYDAFIQGYDTTFFRTITGSVTYEPSTGKIILPAGKVAALRYVMYGTVTFGVTVPEDPTAGDNRVWGLYSPIYGNRNAAYFFISGTNFYARSYANDGTADSTTIAWDEAYTNEDAKYEIRWTIDRVVFLINGLKVATHYNGVPKQIPLPMYFSDDDSNDSFGIDYIEVQDARKIITVTASTTLGYSGKSIRSKANIHTTMGGKDLKSKAWLNVEKFKDMESKAALKKTLQKDSLVKGAIKVMNQKDVRTLGRIKVVNTQVNFQTKASLRNPI